LSLKKRLWLNPFFTIATGALTSVAIFILISGKLQELKQLTTVIVLKKVLIL